MAKQVLGNQWRRSNLTGHSDRLLVVPWNSVRWIDAIVLSLNVNFDRAEIQIEEESGRVVLCHFDGIFSFEVCGIWDEMIIADITFKDEIDVSEYVLDEVRRRNPAAATSGNSARNRKRFYQYGITLGDGAEFKIIAAKMEVCLVE